MGGPKGAKGSDEEETVVMYAVHNSGTRLGTAASTLLPHRAVFPDRSMTAIAVDRGSNMALATSKMKGNELKAMWQGSEGQSETEHSSTFQMILTNLTYMAIIHPLKQRLSSTQTKVIIGVIWVLAFLLTFPQYYYSDVEQLPGRIVCYIDWPEYTVMDFKKIYYVCVAVLIYFLPLLVMGCAYLVVGLNLWASEIPGDCSGRYQEQVNAKRKVVKMMIVVVCTFAVCWLPYHVFFLLHQFFPLLFEKPFIQQVYLAIMWLAMSSTMYNPIIYCCLNDRFRAGFKQAFRWCPCIPSDSYEGLELKSTHYLQTQTSVYKTSRAEPSVQVVNSPSLELASNGSSSRSMSKTVSETSSFYCSNNLPV
ncbi:Substance-P receptor [Bagarius yarrelli]|uniref:Substance-P receptor n=1 Tax=Bagarius yarrelli TaxID=175774 RepID=A0A556V0W1_BAGYA|nr:Substance-P receptor [Bagarius yarrelli]